MTGSPSATGNLADGFAASVAHHPNRPALEIADQEWTYRALADIVTSLSVCMLDQEQENIPRVAICAHRSISAYTGILASLYAGKAYVPLNPVKFPDERNKVILNIAGCEILIVGSEHYETARRLLGEIERSLLVILPDGDAEDLGPIPSHHRVGTLSDTIIEEPSHPLATDLDETAYLLFTSGSTGTPKGVPVSHANALAYVRYMTGRYRLSPFDRTSQFFELTFDPSVHDLFVTWSSGACLCVLSQRETMMPHDFITAKKLTHWYSVPATGMFLLSRRLLKPAAYTKLKLSLFSGEALPQRLAETWYEAAPYSSLENLYGPTEATVNITLYSWNEAASPERCINGVVPIGYVYESQTFRIINPSTLKEAGSLEDGELLLSGSQVVAGYFKNPEKSRAQFCTLPDTGEKRWYRTGDLVRQCPDGCILYLGRIDNQVQIRGHRVELQEVEEVIRQESGIDAVAALGWPIQAGRADHVYAFLFTTETLDTPEIQKKCARRLADYMTPRKMIVMAQTPLNANGKIDRKKLAEQLENMEHRSKNKLSNLKRR